MTLKQVSEFCESHMYDESLDDAIYELDKKLYITAIASESAEGNARKALEREYASIAYCKKKKKLINIMQRSRLILIDRAMKRSLK